LRVSDQSSNIDYLHDLDKKLRAKKESKEREIENLNEMYDKNIENIKANGEERYNQHVQVNEDRLINATKNYEEKLNQYKENLEEAKNNLKAEELAIRDDHTKKMVDLKIQNQSSLQDQYLKGKDTQEFMQSEFKKNTAELSNNFHQEKSKIENQSRENLNHVITDLNSKTATEERNYKEKLDNDIRNHKGDLSKKREDFNGEMTNLSEQHKRLLSEKQTAQNNEKQFLDQHHKNTVLQKEKDFKSRYGTIVNEHNAILDKLKAQFEADAKKIFTTTAEQKRIFENKTQDQFYRIETLNPSIIENEKEVVIAIPVAEYEKDNLQLSAHDRTINMTLSRKFDQNIVEEDGSKNRSNRSEIINKEFSTKELLDHKSIVQKYENGFMKFKITKR
jgi:HSP20 family molecular chaperone IbpA